MPTIGRRPFSFPAYRAFVRLERAAKGMGALLADLGEIATPPWVAEGFRRADPADVENLGLFVMESKGGEPWAALVLKLHRRAIIREGGRKAPEREVLVAVWYDGMGVLNAKRINAIPALQIGAPSSRHGGCSRSDTPGGSAPRRRAARST